MFLHCIPALVASMNTCVPASSCVVLHAIIFSSSNHFSEQL